MAKEEFYIANKPTKIWNVNVDNLIYLSLN